MLPHTMMNCFSAGACGYLDVLKQLPTIFVYFIISTILWSVPQQLSNLRHQGCEASHSNWIVRDRNRLDASLLTSQVEHTKDLAKICHWEKVSITHCGGSDDQKPNDVSEPKWAFFSCIFIVMERVPLVLKKKESSSRPTYEPKSKG